MSFTDTRTGYHRPEAPTGRGWGTAARVGLWAFLAISALFFAIPLFVMLSTSLKTAEEVRGGSVFALPTDPSLAAWGKAWGSACIGRVCEGISNGLWNSVKILVPSTILSVAIAAINGYALSLWRVPYAGLLLAGLLLGAFIPFQVMIYPLVRMFAQVGIYGSLTGVVVVHVLFGLPILTLIFTNFYRSLPPELMKAARVDGAGFFRIFRRIVLPMSANVIIVAVILSFTGVWNDYLLALIFAGRDNLPMTVQLNSLVGTRIGLPEYNVNMAATLIAALPPLILYLISGQYFVRGVTAGAVKG
ncbi:carbohydrate ABC transporter permease [Pseudoroseicyclus tamaricis]|uniref:Carbohydrate ABC transporter permease n=1 Tax=Pseudoroseicyclus tamaricis TaxID=2705421 RepID=A0A6B2JRX8_9RHOB|nr:carbohydrate ABC transporter permease [Pseudoroseicyclus tamaricis]NDV01327.1 carbohydrate ABC transporter permease [Pseudoroseicyclus tamaricis]